MNLIEKLFWKFLWNGGMDKKILWWDCFEYLMKLIIFICLFVIYSGVSILFSIFLWLLIFLIFVVELEIKV